MPRVYWVSSCGYVSKLGALKSPKSASHSLALDEGGAVPFGLWNPQMFWLVVEPTPLKYAKVSWDDEIPNIWINKTCSKPPTRCLLLVLNIHHDITHYAHYTLHVGKFTRLPGLLAQKQHSLLVLVLLIRIEFVLRNKHERNTSYLVANKTWFAVSPLIQWACLKLGYQFLLHCLSSCFPQ